MSGRSSPSPPAGARGGAVANAVVPPLLARPEPAVLALADGATFSGFSLGPAAVVSGEVVFNTSMTGYQEMLTDPSYRGQILVLTTPHVGVVGWNGHDHESWRPWAEALVVPDLEPQPSNWRSSGSLAERLGTREVPIAWGFDVRALVLHLRSHGALPGVLVCGRGPRAAELAALAAASRGTDGRDLTREVARDAATVWTEAPWAAPGARVAAGGRRVRIAVLDCGAKNSILRHLVGAGGEVTVLPPATAAAELLRGGAAGVVVSNGPGDPAAVAAVPETLRALLGRVPLLGICLGHQLLGLALGGRTYKLPFGHHGGNHPVRDETTGQVWITSQNHNYAVDPASLPADVRVTMSNLTDGSVEAIGCAALDAQGIQFHPEAGPGPHDALGVFARFVARCRERQGMTDGQVDSGRDEPEGPDAAAR